MAIVEQYYIGALYHGIGNGVTDGAPFAVFIMIALGFLSREFVTSELIKGVWFS